LDHCSGFLAQVTLFYDGPLICYGDVLVAFRHLLKLFSPFFVGFPRAPVSELVTTFAGDTPGPPGLSHALMHIFTHVLQDFPEYLPPLAGVADRGTLPIRAAIVRGPIAFSPVLWHLMELLFSFVANGTAALGDVSETVAHIVRSAGPAGAELAPTIVAQAAALAGGHRNGVPPFSRSQHPSGASPSPPSPESSPQR
jgi:hypothetical protein